MRHSLSWVLLLVGFSAGVGLPAVAQDHDAEAVAPAAEAPPPAESAPTASAAPARPDVTVTSVDARGNGIAVVGDVRESNMNSNQNVLSNGGNTNLNAVRPVIYTPTSTSGGSSLMVLPRNPLPLGNALLGRSNFGFQFGVQNNPGLGNLLTGGNNALGWFAQGGVTIPFGKIPEVVSGPKTRELDAQRELDWERRRQIFGDTAVVRKAVQGEVRLAPPGAATRTPQGLSAYHFSPVAAGRVPGAAYAPAMADVAERSRLLAMGKMTVYAKPLEGEKPLGRLDEGSEVGYIGHTSTGWVKVLLSDGREGWAQGPFEPLQRDYLQVKTLTATRTARQVPEVRPEPAGVSLGTVSLKPDLAPKTVAVSRSASSARTP